MTINGTAPTAENEADGIAKNGGDCIKDVRPGMDPDVPILVPGPEPFIQGPLPKQNAKLKALFPKTVLVRDSSRLRGSMEIPIVTLPKEQGCNADV